MSCKNPLPHGPHDFLADSDAVTLSPCPGRENLYTEAEVARLQDSEVRTVLKGLLRNLTDVRRQRGVIEDDAPLARKLQMRGEIEGLNIAISAVKRRIR